jgi:hypothetical protein
VARTTRCYLTLLHRLAMTRQAVRILENLPGLDRLPLCLGLSGSVSLRLDWELVLLSLSLQDGRVLGGLSVNGLTGQFRMYLLLLLLLLLLLSRWT